MRCFHDFFAKKSVRVDFRNLHTAVCSKISVKSTLFLVTTLHKTLIWRNNMLIFRKNSDLVFWRLFNTVTRLFISHLVILVNLSRWGWSTLHTMGNHSYHIWKIRSHLMKISLNQLYCKNNAAFTKKRSVISAPWYWYSCNFNIIFQSQHSH